MEIRISVVIPTYRRPALLRACLQALRGQNLKAEDFEVLVVSDGYDRETEEVVHSFRDTALQVGYFHLAQKMGPAAARNLGWKRARGRLIAFTDDDCLPDANWLNGFLGADEGMEEIAFTGKIRVPLSHPPTDYEKNTAGLETAGFVTANCCCSRKALEKTGGFDERFSMAWREDSDLEFKLLLQGIPIRRSVDALVVHPVRKAPWGVSIKEQKKGMFNALLYKKYPDLYRQKIRPRPNWNYYLMVLSVGMLITGWAQHQPVVTTGALLLWGTLEGRFIYKRLKQTSKSLSHVAEMVFTSLVIPFASVYWHFYGAFKYRVLFL